MRRIRLVRDIGSIPKGRMPDIRRIQEAFVEVHDAEVTDYQAYEMWSDYSDSMAAGWLFLPPDSWHICEAVSPYYEVIYDADEEDS